MEIPERERQGSSEHQSLQNIAADIAPASQSAAQAARLTRPEWRIAWLTLAVGLLAAVIAAWRISWRAGCGVMVGSLLAWVNFRWLQGALDALVRVSVIGEGKSTARIPFWTYVRFFARYLLIAMVLYGMVTRFGVPILSLLGGLCALGAATMLEGLYEVIARPE